MTSGFLRIAIVLGLISAIGPFAIDMYLPALPTIGADLGASPLAVQMSLVVVFLSFAIGPLIVGPLAGHVWPQAGACMAASSSSRSPASARRSRQTSSG